MPSNLNLLPNGLCLHPAVVGARVAADFVGAFVDTHFLHTISYIPLYAF